MKCVSLSLCICAILILEIDTQSQWKPIQDESRNTSSEQNVTVSVSTLKENITSGNFGLLLNNSHLFSKDFTDVLKKLIDEEPGEKRNWSTSIGKIKEHQWSTSIKRNNSPEIHFNNTNNSNFEDIVKLHSDTIDSILRNTPKVDISEEIILPNVQKQAVSAYSWSTSTGKNGSKGGYSLYRNHTHDPVFNDFHHEQRYSDAVNPDKPGLCFFEDLDNGGENKFYLKPGQKRKHPKLCYEVNCSEDFTLYITGCAGKGPNIRNCHFIEGDRSKPFPRCCGEYVC